MFFIEIGFYSIVLSFVALILYVFLPENWEEIRYFLISIVMPLYGGGFFIAILGIIMIWNR